MLIQVPKTRWVRDEGVSELIDHFDQPERYQKWDKLTAKEFSVIEKEMEKCRADFSYASRNYFWIQDKETRQDILFRLWESQELLLEIITDLKRKGRSQRIIIIKARQLGCSTVVEGLIAWRSFFFTNINSLIVSFSPEHSSYLYSIATHIFDKLPWWLRPMIMSREIKTGMILDNPDHDDRAMNPGLNSKVMVNWANAMTGVGQGVRLSAAHLSEFADWDDRKARDIIEEDMLNALADSPETFAVLESTAKGAGRYAHKLWVDSEQLADKSQWTPIFLPWFFDKSHRRSISIKWKPQKEESEMREKIKADWVRCDNALCRQFHRRTVYGRDYTETKCPTCDGIGTLRVFTISDEQLAWMEWRRENAQNDEESLQKLRQEQATTAEEAFVISGKKLFSDQAMTFATRTVRDPRADGFVDKTLKFHGMNMNTGKCFMEGCHVDHSYDENRGLTIFEFPEQGAEYVIGADVSEGIGQDYSVAQILKLNKYGGPDVQVGVYARNDIDPVTFGETLNKLGRFYNNALIAVEINKYDSAETTLRLNMSYPNCYIGKNITSENLISKRYGWLTSKNSKPRLYHTLRKRLDARLVYIRDKFTVEELKWFRKDDDSEKTGAAQGFHDDRIMAFMIALYVAHELDWDEDNGIVRVTVPLTLETAPWAILCAGCSSLWPASTPAEYRRCPKCHSMHITARHNADPAINRAQNPLEDTEPGFVPDEDVLDDDQLPEYDLY